MTRHPSSRVVWRGPPSRTARRRRGVWATNEAGQLVLVARTGQAIDVGLGQPLVITNLDLWSATGGEDGRATSFNSDGDLALHVTLSSVVTPSGGSASDVSAAGLPATLSGILVVDLSSIPEPPVAGMAALLLFARPFVRPRRFLPGPLPRLGR